MLAAIVCMSPGGATATSGYGVALLASTVLKETVRGRAIIAALQFEPRFS
jgi:hypothetical protein